MQVIEHPMAREAWQGKIQDNRIWQPRIHLMERLEAIHDFEHIEAGVRQEALEELPDIQVIFNEQDAAIGHGRA